jgi:hypothetical protein
MAAVLIGPTTKTTTTTTRWWRTRNVVALPICGTYNPNYRVFWKKKYVGPNSKPNKF